MPSRRNLAGAAAAALLLLASHTAGAAPRLPTSDSEVLETVRPRTDPVSVELRLLAEQVRQNPADPRRAILLARRYISLGRSLSDPRQMGRAEAVLAPWFAQTPMLLEIRFLRAALRQYAHDFDGALGDLDSVIVGAPNAAEPVLARANLRLLRGDMAGAAADCASLDGRTTALVAATCRASVQGMTGQGAAARSAIAAALATPAPQDSVAVRVWALNLAGSIAARMGDAGDAERQFLAALALAPDDVATRSAHADLLLDTGRAAQARALLEREAGSDPVLLRLAIAATLTRAADADALTGRMLDRLDEARRRGDASHLREAARAHLDLRPDPRRALDFARRNWAIQREPEDARLLLAAAVLAGQPAAARPVLEWLAETGVEDVAASALAVRVSGSRL
jgi:tetratricopeptide (TPR) repeat protein